MTSKIDGVAGHIEIDGKKKVEYSKDALEMKAWLNKFHDIEEKNKCLRVQFLDWLSDKLLDWSNSIHEMSVHIDSPCVIKVTPRKKEESTDAKERKEIAKLKENLARLNADNDKLRNDRKEFETTKAMAEKLLAKETAGNIAVALGDVKR